MSTIESYLHKFQKLLRELFQFDCQDLDFGIYRVLHLNRKQVEEFVSERLPKANCLRCFLQEVGEFAVLVSPNPVRRQWRIGETIGTSAA